MLVVCRPLLSLAQFRGNIFGAIDEVANLVSTIRAVSAFIGWRVMFTTDTLAPFSCWSNRTSDETTSAIWTDVFE
jgi:hypothetical protein